MKLRNIVAVSALLLGCVASTACKPPVDGGWDGNADCGSNSFPLDAILNEDNAGNLDGTIFIQGLIFNTIAKGVIDNGERRDDGSYRGDLQTDSDPTPEFSFDFAYDGDDVDTLRGHVDTLDNNGQTTDTCKLKLERVSVAD